MIRLRRSGCIAVWLGLVAGGFGFEAITDHEWFGAADRAWAQTVAIVVLLVAGQDRSPVEAGSL